MSYSLIKHLILIVVHRWTVFQLFIGYCRVAWALFKQRYYSHKVTRVHALSLLLFSSIEKDSGSCSRKDRQSVAAGGRGEREIKCDGHTDKIK